MDIEQIKLFLQSPNSQERLQAVTQLRQYDTEIAVSLLISVMYDKEFIVRSFVAMALGKKRTAESFAALQEIIKSDSDPNVRAEAANSLSMFGEISTSELVEAFRQDDNWLVRLSILAALVEMRCPEALFEVCSLGICGEDITVREASVDGFSWFAGTKKEDAALQKILAFTDAEQWRLRARVAKALSKFESVQAKEALNQLRQDDNHRVVGATLENLV